MRLYNILGLVGFIFSAIAAGLGASISLSAIGFFPWGLSIVLRGIGWILCSRALNSILYLATGAAVIVLGISSIGSMIFVISILPSFQGTESLSPFFLPAILWALYSLMEFFSYLSLKTRWFRIASTNIVAIAIILVATIPLNIISDGAGIFLVIGSFIIMVISAIFAAVGFSKVSPANP